MAPAKKPIRAVLPRTALPRVFFIDAEDILALGMARNILSLYQNTPFYEAARNLLDCITAPMEAEGNRGCYENRIVVPERLVATGADISRE